MNVLRILIYALKVLLNRSINKYGLQSEKTLNLSQRLDNLIVNIQNYKYYQDFINLN